MVCPYVHVTHHFFCLADSSTPINRRLCQKVWAQSMKPQIRYSGFAQVAASGRLTILDPLELPRHHVPN